MSSNRFTGDFNEAIVTRPEHQVEPTEDAKDNEKADDEKPDEAATV